MEAVGIWREEKPVMRRVGAEERSALRSQLLHKHRGSPDDILTFLPRLISPKDQGAHKKPSKACHKLSLGSICPVSLHPLTFLLLRPLVSSRADFLTWGWEYFLEPANVTEVVIIPRYSATVVGASANNWGLGRGLCPASSRLSSARINNDFIP